MAKLTADKFVDLAQRSKLVDRDQLSRAVDALTEDSAGGTVEAAAVAERLIEQGHLTRWQANKLLEGRHKGFVIGKYKLLDHLGTGGMSSVYLGEHLLMHRQVAIKVLPKARVGDTESSYLERFRREAQAVAALDHPNIVRAYDIDNEGDTHFIVMEYVDGSDLNVIVRETGPLSYVDAANYIRQSAKALDHSHAAGVIHRDMKPANILVDREGVAKVLDLGLARFTKEDEQASLTVAYDENVLGTADYLAPEQAVDSHGVDHRADIYGLGCSLYFILTGHAPFCEGTLPQRLMSHQKDPPPSIFDDRPDAPPDLVAICLRMMAKRPEDRYQTAGEVAQVLGRWLNDQGSGSSSGDGESSDTGGKSSRLLVAAAIEAAAGKAGGDGGSSRIRRARAMDDGDQKPVPTARPLGSPLPDAALPTAAPLEVHGDDDPESATSMLPVARSAEHDTAVPKLTNVEPAAVARLRAKANISPEEAQARRVKAHDLPVWIWFALGAGCVLILLLAVRLFAG